MCEKVDGKETTHYCYDTALECEYFMSYGGYMESKPQHDMKIYNITYVYISFYTC